MKMTRMLLSLIAWFAFTLILRLVGPNHVGWAGAAALTIAVVFLFMNARGGLKILDVSSVVTFAVLTVIGFTGGPTIQEVIADYGRGACALVLGLVMAISAVTVPFTEQYARESMPRQYVTSPVFRAVNRKISGIWAAIILVMAAGHFLDGYLDAIMNGPTRVVVDLLLNWAVPIGVTIVGIHFTKATIAAAHKKATQEAASR